MSKYMPFDYKCTSCGHVHERYAKPEKTTDECPVCGAEMVRLPSIPKFPLRQGADPDMPTAADRWARVHKQGAKIDEQRAADNGPDSWGSSGGDIRR